MPLIAPDLSVPWQNLLESIFVGTAVILLVLTACIDAKTRRIPNAMAASIGIFAIGRLVALGDPITAIYTLLAAFLVLFVTFLLFTRNLIGGGDVKLLTATVLLVGYHAVFLFLAIMSICGGILAVAIFLWLMTVKTKKQPSVPYGVAIAAGAIITLSLNPMIG